MPDKITIAPEHEEIGIGEILNYLPLIAEAAMVVPQLAAAKVGDTVNTPDVPGLRIAHGKFSAHIVFTKTG